MTEIPSTFISKKTFRSLPQLAMWTWLTVLITDAVLFQRFDYSFYRVAGVWIVGMVVSLLFEWARYKSLSNEERTEYGSKFFLLLNAFLIFLYASSYSGLTKQIGVWGELDATRDSSVQTNKAAFLSDIKEWSIPLLARQTAYFPDVLMLSENEKIKQENKQLKDSLTSFGRQDSQDTVTRLNNRIISLTVLLNNCQQSPHWSQRPSTDMTTTTIYSDKIISLMDSLKICQAAGQRLHALNDRQAATIKQLAAELNACKSSKPQPVQ